ncbi:MAG: hypothetical protein KKH61_21050 [Gammaproteobacteria bacterium]|nr:hypothetical protein [Gammaproteobacteria bacterium]
MAKISVVVDGEGKFMAFLNKDQGSYTGAKKELAGLLETLTEAGIDFSDIGQIEQHTHEVTVVSNKIVAGGDHDH